MNTIINNEKSFKKTLKFFKKYFENVKHIKNDTSHLASRSQNFFSIILFENRGKIFSVKWNYNHSTLFFGDITKNKKTTFQYVFTKMAFDECYPIEEMNNANIVFWEYEIIHPNDDMPQVISPLRMPITKRS
jgi:hypothetical protein